MASPIHLRPSAEVAERVLLPGDPHRALFVAQALLESPRMLNHSRGLWGYTGMARDGEPLTVQSTGMGGPSAAIVVEELLELGACRLIRIGTCGALAGGLDLGELVAVRAVMARDGASAALGAGPTLSPDRSLTAALACGGAREVTAVSTDLFYDPDEARQRAWARAGAEVVEMEAAAVLSAAASRRAPAAVLLAVTDLISGSDRRRIDHEGLQDLGIALGEAAYAAFASGD